MNFDPSEDQRALQDSVARLLADTYAFEQRRAIADELTQPLGLACTRRTISVSRVESNVARVCNWSVSIVSSSKNPHRSW